MTTQVSSQQIAVEEDVNLSYFVDRKGEKSARMCPAKLLDISNTGLLMEVSLDDSELFLETQGTLFPLNKRLELYMYGRAWPINVSVWASIQWFRKKTELCKSAQSDDVFVGVAFSLESLEQRNELTELVKGLGKDLVKCRECGTTISADAILCFNCGTRLLRKRTFFKNLLSEIFGKNGTTPAN